jgi:mannose/fructose/N-acetylgalactosamine-specific phosphotransferase system component IIC
MTGVNMQLLDTTPKWLGLTLACSACTLVVVGLGFLVNQLIQVNITPFSLLLHFALAVTLSAWILNLRFTMDPAKKPLLAIGVVVVVGLIWSSFQQWLGYLQTGLINDITLLAGATLMDAVGGCVTYALFHLRLLRK